MQKYLFIPGLFVIFALASVCCFFSETAIKRETGVNPVQSRCCKFHHSKLSAIPLPLISCKGGREGAAQRNKSEDLPLHTNFIIAFEEKALSLK